MNFRGCKLLATSYKLLGLAMSLLLKPVSIFSSSIIWDNNSLIDAGFPKFNSMAINNCVSASKQEPNDI